MKDLHPLLRQHLESAGMPVNRQNLSFLTQVNETYSRLFPESEDSSLPASVNFFSLVPFGVLILDASGQIQFRNDPANQFLKAAGKKSNSVHEVFSCLTHSKLNSVSEENQQETSICELQVTSPVTGIFPLFLEIVVVPFPSGDKKFFLVTLRDVSAKMMSESAIRRLSRVLEDSPDMILFVDPGSFVMYQNLKMESFTGKDNWTLKLDHLFTHSGISVVRDLVIPRSRESGLWQGETELISRSHEKIPVLMTVNSHKKEDGSVEFFSFVFKDMTEKKKVERALDEQRTVLVDALGLARMGTWELDILTMKVTVSPELKTLLKIPQSTGDETTIDMIRRGLFPTEYTSGLKLLNDAVTEKRTFSLEFRFRDQEGQLRYFLGFGRPVLNPKGEVVTVRGTIQDFTDRKTDEIRLAGFYRQLQDLQNAMNASAIISITDSRGVILEANDNFCQVAGYSREELVGQSHRIVNSGFHSKDFFRILWDTIKAGKVWKGEIKNISKLGVPYWVDATIFPILDEFGKPSRFMAIRYDITERKLAEQELLKAKNAAEAADKAKTEFLATMSHEIRTPMNGVIGMTALMLETNLNAEQRDYAETIKSSGENLLEIINDILDFSKIETGKLELDYQPLALDFCIEEVIDLLAPKINQKNLDFAYCIDTDVPASISGDAFRLRQILVNLIGNAVKFTETGGIEVHVSRIGRQDHATTIRFEIKDTGIGIPAEKIPLLFESFTQVDSSTSRKYGGTGLGLAITRKLVSLMQGTISVSSTPGKGSVFTFTLPATVSKKRQNPFSGAEKNLIENRLIVILDDSPIRSKSIRTTLEMYGFSAISGPEAEKSDPDVLILPGEKFGREAEIPLKWKDIPVVALNVPGREYRGQPKTENLIPVSLPFRHFALAQAVLQLLARTQPKPKSEKPGSLDKELAEKFPLRLLLAEDNPVNQKLALNVLKKMGYAASVAENGLEVLKKLEEQDFDIILMDIQMPEMDGLEATRQIRTLYPERPVKIIAMTANAMDGDREKCIDSGMDDYLSKPFKLTDVQELLIRYSGKNRTGPNETH